MRPRPDDRHLAAQHVQELRQFVEAGAAQEGADPGDSRVVATRQLLAAKAGPLLYQEAVKHYDSRHRVKPGITGWAQVNGWRGETDTVEQIRKRVEHDLYYIEHWSIAFDLKIILRTALGGFTGRNAF